MQQPGLLPPRTITENCKERTLKQTTERKISGPSPSQVLVREGSPGEEGFATQNGFKPEWKIDGVIDDESGEQQKDAEDEVREKD